jgi:hypothetical protein
MPHYAPTTDDHPAPKLGPPCVHDWAVPPWHDESVDKVRLGYGPEGMFILSDPKRGEDGELWSVVATLEVEGLRASKKISVHYATCMDELIAYFDDLAEHWQGWMSIKTYRSLEGDLVIGARHDGRHVLLDVEIKRNHLPRESSAQGQDPGAQMAQAASAAHVMLARSL